MAQNITLLGASYSDVPAVVLPKTGGGTASFTDVTATTATASDVASGKIFFLADGTQTTGTSSGGGGGGSYPWFGPNTVKDYTKTITINLKNNTSWDSWTASTTAGTILSSPTTNDFSYTFDHTQYVAFVVMQAVTNYVYKSTATKVKIPISTGRVNCYCCYTAPNSYDQYQSFTPASTISTNIFERTPSYYFDSSGVKKANLIQFGVYVSNPVLSTGRSENIYTIEVKRPLISAKCAANYFDTERKGDIDSENTDVVIKFDVYKTPRNSAMIPVLYDSLATLMNASPEN